MHETSANLAPSPEELNARIEELFNAFMAFPTAVAHLDPWQPMHKTEDYDSYKLKKDKLDININSWSKEDSLMILHRDLYRDDPENIMSISYSIPGRRYKIDDPNNYTNTETGVWERNTDFQTLIERTPDGMKMTTLESGYNFSGGGHVEFNSWTNDPEDIERLRTFIDKAPDRLVLGNPDIFKEIFERERKSSRRLSRLRAPLNGLVDFSNRGNKGVENDDRIVEFNYDDYPEVMKEDELPAGPGLKLYEIDKFQTNDFGGMICCPGYIFEETMDKILESYKAADPNIKDPAVNPDKIYATAIMSGSRVTPELQNWINRNRLQNAYFTPEMVVESLGSNEDVRVKTSQHDNLLVWEFITNEGKTLKMSRTADGSTPEFNRFKDPTVNPYLAVRYDAEYDQATQEIVCVPRIGDGFGEIKGKTGRIIKSALGVKEQRIHQPVEFRLVGAGPKMFYEPFEGDIEPTYTNIGAYIVADFPDSKAPLYK